ncbi:MAG: hypothetical protein PVG61_07470 [Dehalococcoidia bacterium]
MEKPSAGEINVEKGYDINKMKCQRCQREIQENDSFTHLGEVLCEDCYMDVRSPAKSCDPWAVYTATRTRETTGLSGAEGLNTLQQAIYNYIKNKGRATPEEIITKFNITPKDLQNQIATLRHCELVKGSKDGSDVYLVPFSR